MGIWGKRAPGSGGLIDDRCWSDPALDQVIDLLEAHAGPADPEQVAAAVGHLATVAKDPDRLDVAVRGIGQRLTQDLPALRRATDAAESDTELADTLALLGSALRWAAWEARGGGWSETVGSDDSYTFHTLLDEADEVLRAGLELAPGHAAMAHCRIWTAIGLGGLTEEAWWERFAAVQAVSPSFFAGHMSMLQALCQKWHGSHDVMFDFALQAARTAPIGSPVGAVLAMAHCEYRLLAQISEFKLLEG